MICKHFYASLISLCDFPRIHPITYIAILLGMLSGCAADNATNPDDPLENRGIYDVAVNQVDIPNPENTNAPFSAKVYFPSLDGGASWAAGDYKLIVLTPGFAASFNLYERYAKHFTSHGFVVLGFDFASGGNVLDGGHEYKARQISYVIDYAASELSGLAQYIDSDHVGLVGHSMGAKVSFYAAALDARISVISAMDPVNAGGPPCFIFPAKCAAYPVAPNPAREMVGVLDNINVASLILRSEPDSLVNPEEEFNASWFFYGYDGFGLHGVPSPAVYVDLGKVSHIAYVPLFSKGVASFSKRIMTAWFKTHLQGELMDAYYDGAIIQEDIAAGRVLSVDYR